MRGLVPALVFATALVLGVAEAASRLKMRFAALAAVVASSVISLVILGRVFAFDRSGRVRRRLLGLTLEEIDLLEGRDFEQWIHAVLERDGLRVDRTRPGSDFGVDLIAHFEGHRVGIEAKRRRDSVSNGVVRSVLAGATFHGCDFAAIVTPAKFTKSARLQASRSRPSVFLLGREALPNLAWTLRNAVARAADGRDLEPKQARAL